MISIRRKLTASIFLGCTLLAAAAGAQETTVIVPVAAPAPTFSFPLGSVQLVPDGVTCSVQATAPRASAAKAQQMKFVVDYQGQIPGSHFRYYTISTGRSKSLAEVQAMFADGFARSLLAPPGAELCKLGDIAYGGEVRLVARGNGET